MKQLLLVVLCAGILSFYSCEKSTDADEYNSIWKPYSETKWVRSGSAAEEFKPTTGGFTFKANIADTGTYSYTFVPSIYIVSNITTASSGVLSFRGAILDGSDTIALAAGGTQVHSFAQLSGFVTTKGADSVDTAPKPFVSNTATLLPLSVNPDSCSREIRFTVNVAWNAFSGGATVSPLPTTKKVTIEFYDIEMRINGIDVLSE
ncbi:MAG: hypothetical protein ACYC09_03490 [Bacteroidota bacterium]